MKGIEKTLFIEATELIRINGQTYIPTALYYYEEKRETLFGQSAIDKLTQNKIVNTNFKVELGDYNINQKRDDRKLFEAADGSEKSAFQLADDFFGFVLENVEGQILIPSYEKKGLKIIVAEPLSFQIQDTDSNWIKNYRENIRRILHHYDTVEFLPEPFAVYQFYRYGLKIPQLQDKLKHIALIIDFGGGTFDVSIIESTRSGDISSGGKHSKPLAASSQPIGGFYINEKIGDYLIKRSFEKDSPDRKKAEQYIRTFRRVKKGELDYDSLNDEKRAFIKNLGRLIQLVESEKINLCNRIRNWDINADCYDKVLINIPQNPFSKNTAWYSAAFYGHELRKIFLREIWNKNIRKIVRSAIDRASDSLKGKEITVTLISGGSSNIRWLEKLVISEFSDELGHAKPVPLSASFQEVVAKGLAIECARRYYDPESEFVSVTYNPVRLLLNPDDKGLEVKKYISIENKIDMGGSKDGDLIPSAQALKYYTQEPLQWRVRLNHPPKHFLRYYFMRPSNKPINDQPNDLHNLYNINNIVYTTPGTKFGGKIRVELVIKADGTAIPKFIYRVGHGDAGVEEYAETGAPFVLDMTSDNEMIDANRYIGFDFGTSNSSVCFLTNEHIHTLEIKSKDRYWLELKQLVTQLPYPISYLLRKYLSVIDIEKSVDAARDAFEAFLGFAAYIAASELLANNKFDEGIMKSFAHRSMGPLKDLLSRCLTKLGRKAFFSEPFSVLFSKHLEELELAISNFNKHKHKMLSAKLIDCHTYMKLMGNICHKAMQNRLFGYFEDIRQVKFKKGVYSGIFRLAHDNQPFMEALNYKGKSSFNTSEPIIVDLDSKKGLSLFPFFFWDEEPSNLNNIRCYIFDKVKKKSFFYKAIDEDASIELDSRYEDLKDQMDQIVMGSDTSSSILDIELSHT